ncbi:MAG: hypothetical protein ABL879_16380 [Devosia sp.]
MRAANYDAIIARATTGQHLAIRYDRVTNAITFVEDDWIVDARGGAAPRSEFREQLETAKIKLFRRRSAA